MKKFLLISAFLLGNSAIAQLQEGAICISPSRLSVAKGTKSWVYIDRDTNSPGKEIWESGYSAHHEAGLFEGIFASARVAKRSVIINPLELRSIRSDTNFNRIEAQDRLANAVKIDVNNECNTSK